MHVKVNTRTGWFAKPLLPFIFFYQKGTLWVKYKTVEFKAEKIMFRIRYVVWTE